MCESLKEFIKVSHGGKVKLTQKSQLPLMVANLVTVVLSHQSI